MNIDLSIHIRRQPESENYRLDLLLIQNNAPGKSEHHICQTLAEAFQKAVSFESKHLHPFENAIEYEKTDWRELARQNRESAKKAEAAGAAGQRASTDGGDGGGCPPRLIGGEQQKPQSPQAGEQQNKSF